MKRYQVYKGLQKPLSYKGFKGKFIYWGIATLLFSLVIGAILMATINMYFGAGVIVLLIFAGFSSLASKQKQGLHSKNRLPGVFIHAAKNYFHATKASI